jgi:hypothetical protein
MTSNELETVILFNEEKGNNNCIPSKLTRPMRGAEIPA